MKRLLYVILTLALLIGLTACGGQTTTGGDQGASTTGGGSNAQPTATKIVLATPTPKPAPATPTPKPSPTPMPTAEPAQETTDASAAEPTATAEAAPALNVEMVPVPAGPFTMGSDKDDPEDSPAQTVDLPAFEIDKFEVTNDDFALFVAATGYTTDVEKSGGVNNWKDKAEGRGNHPVVYVSWNDATAFCEWAGKRIPTEAEWEKAARGDDGRIYPWGNDFDASLANVKETGLRSTTAVGSFPGGASPYGAEDMAGNVWEWTADWYKAYPNSASQDPYYGERFRVTRGGAWFEEAAQLTTFNRNAAEPNTSANDDLGFRCVRDAK